jgi:LysM repeat protein
MPRRSPARYLAPLAIVAFLVALSLVITSSGSDAPVQQRGADAAATPEPTSEEQGSERSDKRRRAGRRTYTVRPGDTPSTIAERTGVPLEELEALNPDIDPQQLTPGQRLRLRR